MTKIGTPLKIEDFEEPFKAVLDDVLTIGSVLYDQLRPHMRKPWATRAFRITINDRPELNAVTWLDADTYCVAIFRGAIEQIFGTMFGLFSCPSFLPGIGNALAEIKPSSIPAGGFPKMPLLEYMADVTNRVDTFLPKDPSRVLAAHMLAHVAIQFLVGHEIGHIVGGHHELCQAIGMNTMISEIHADSQSDHFRLRQILECDADAFAGDLSQIHTDKIMEPVISEIVNANDWSPEEKTHVTYLAAVAVLFRILSATSPSKINATNSSHPHPASRALMVGSCMLARSLGTRELSTAEAEPLLENLLSRSVRNIEDVWADLFLPSQVTEPPARWGESVRDNAHELFASYEAERPMLEKYAHLSRRWHYWHWHLET